MRRGFTLVELSIVLVIIGLLIGGILVAQSMIDTAKVQNFVRQIQQYDIAIRNFKTKYSALPGDSPNFDSPGDGDGVVEPNVSIDVPYFDDEEANFWRHLSEADFQPDKTIYDNDASSGVRVGINIPAILGFKGNVGGKIGAIVTEDPNYGENILTYVIADYSQTNSDWWPGNMSGALTPQQALAIDSKIDDGKSRVIPGPNQFSGIMSEYGNCTNLATGEYVLTETKPVCRVVIKALQGQPN